MNFEVFLYSLYYYVNSLSFIIVLATLDRDPYIPHAMSRKGL